MTLTIQIDDTQLSALKNALQVPYKDYKAYLDYFLKLAAHGHPRPESFYYVEKIISARKALDLGTSQWECCPDAPPPTAEVIDCR